jgi:pSer/pThr/pTyr-binding forkhead associated (FHA) protein
MQDGNTRKLTRGADAPETRDFFEKRRASLVTLTGTTAGNEYALDGVKLVVGRGPEAQLRFDDSAMSREHAVFELTDEGFRVRDLGSTNGLSVNGHPTLIADLDHGDRIALGEHTFQYILEDRTRDPRAYVVDDD